MARWTDCYRLCDVRDRRADLQASGVYELGFVRRTTGGSLNLFTPLYVGKAKVLYNRLSSYISARCHNELVWLQYETGHLHIWYHTFKTLNYSATESRLQNRLGIGGGGYYRWNKRIETQRYSDELM